jgi:hypothetical protein
MPTDLDEIFDRRLSMFPKTGDEYPLLRRPSILAGTPPHNGATFDGIWLDELVPIDEAFYHEIRNTMSKETAIHPEVAAALESLVERINTAIDTPSDTDPVMSLTGPATLTVSVPGKGYRKHPHVGGEDFTPKNVRVGAGGKLIFAFKPAAAAQYTEMEMNEVDAAAQLDSFRAFANTAVGGDFFGELRAIRQLATKAREAEEVVEKSAQYREFGTW